MADVTPAAVMVEASDPERGCAQCGANGTVLLHPHHGRQCPDHMTLPIGPFRSDLAADMVDLGRADAAFTYLAGWLAAEVTRRFAMAAR